VALDFPNSPSNGQLYEGFVYDSTVGAWRVRVQPALFEVDYLIHGGGTGGNGGSSSAWFGTGGAAGIARTGTARIEPGTYYLSVGAGAPGTALVTARGGDSYISATANGYGFGFTAQGALENASSTRPGGNNADFSGGAGSGTLGGGGAGAAASGSVGNGGAGLTSTITGTSIQRGGGGAGANSGTAGAGGGGAVNSAGSVNTGSGGGGSTSGAGSAGGNGASGVIVLRLFTTASVSFSVGVTHTTTTVGDKTAYIVTAAGPTDTVTIS